MTVGMSQGWTRSCGKECSQDKTGCRTVWMYVCQTERTTRDSCGVLPTVEERLSSESVEFKCTNCGDTSWIGSLFDRE